MTIGRKRIILLAGIVIAVIVVLIASSGHTQLFIP